MKLDPALVLVILGLALFPAGVRARECVGPPAACLPGLDEHGSIASAAVAAPLPAPGAKAPEIGAEGSRPVTATREGRRSDDDVVGGLPAYDPQDAFFSSSLADRIASLGECRVEVARVRRIRPGDLPADTAHLRLWVAPDGRVFESVVVTEGAIGPGFLDCLKREVQGWRLLPPQSGKGAYVDVEADIPISGTPAISGPRPAPSP